MMYNRLLHAALLAESAKHSSTPIQPCLSSQTTGLLLLYPSLTTATTQSTLLQASLSQQINAKYSAEPFCRQQPFLMTYSMLQL